MDMKGDCKSTDALDDAKLCMSMAANSVRNSEHITATKTIPSTSRPIRAFVNGSIPSHLKRRLQRRRGNPTRAVLTQQERISTEGQCKSTHALDDAKPCMSMPTTGVRNLSEYVTATDQSMPSSSSTEVGIASRLGCEPSPSNCVSSRIARMMEHRSEYVSALEFEIEASKDHWSQLDPTSALEEGNIETDWEVFCSLQKKWGIFFWDWGDDLVVGEKIAEGGQAEIFKAELRIPYNQISNAVGDDFMKDECILKVFKEGWSLRDLEEQWPEGMLQKSVEYGVYNSNNSCMINEAVMLKNGRFAFRMQKYWGDLRKLIDLRMQLNDNRSPPFINEKVERTVFEIALGMRELHKYNIIHRDLKASNVLISNKNYKTFDPANDYFDCIVADFECSVGVVGTGFWRAPEILRAVQIRDIKSYLFTKKSDVYSFAMTCYEVLTGCIPFEGLGGNCYDIIFDGKRPKLPNHVDPWLKTLLNRCWHENPLERPSFADITEQLKKTYPHLIRLEPTQFRLVKSGSEMVLERVSD